MRPEAQYRDAVKRLADGLPDAAVSRELGIPRRTVTEWRIARRSERVGRTSTRYPPDQSERVCPICEDRPLDQAAYAYLLGLYLGDGCLSPQGRRSWKLRIVQDARYQRLIRECSSAMEKVLGSDLVRLVDRTTYLEIHSSWDHWLCLFPQHGPGPKHRRLISLDPWQETVVLHETRALVAGMIHADGTRHVNQVIASLRSGPKRYRYTRYQFVNTSVDIRRIFTDALDRLDIGWTRAGPKTISIARKADVMAIDEFVGPKR